VKDIIDVFYVEQNFRSNLMSYFVITELRNVSYDTGYVDWSPTFYEFDLYCELIEFLANIELDSPGQFKVLGVYKSENNFLDLYSEDVDKRIEELKFERLDFLQQLKKDKEDLERRREKEIEIEERNLLNELLAKYGIPNEKKS
jgi:hypothetical protein